MSDTPPDRKEAADAPAGPKNPWVGWLVWVVLVPVVYVLSSGPMAWLMDKGYLPSFMAYPYLPLSYLPDVTRNQLGRYVEWWVQ